MPSSFDGEQGVFYIHNPIDRGAERGVWAAPAMADGTEAFVNPVMEP